MSDLSQIRQEIDEIDDKLRPLLRKRAEKALEIREIKCDSGMPTQDRKREDEIFEKCETDFEKAIFETILKESRKLQSRSLL